MAQNLRTRATPEFTEEEYISALETHLNLCAFRGGQVAIHRVSQDKERDLGYDGVMNSIVPIYIQFKRSYFCTSHFNGKTKKDRVKHSLGCSRGFYEINLHKDKKTQKFEQQNALWVLSKSHTAVYVAPLFYKRSRIDNLRHYDPRLPWRYHKIRLIDSNAPTLRREFSRVKLFHDSVTIPPHREIADKSPSHKYTVDTNLEVCFHSDPEPLEGHCRLLSDLLHDLLTRSKEGPIDPNTAANNLLSVLPKLYESDWQTEIFRDLVTRYLEELYITEIGDVSLKWVSENLHPHQKFELIEIALERDFSILQFLVHEHIN